MSEVWKYSVSGACVCVCTGKKAAFLDVHARVELWHLKRVYSMGPEASV